MKSMIRAAAFSALIALPLAVSLPAMAQTAAAAAPAAQAMSADMADGEIRKISKELGKVTIKHGAIKNLDMPPMTMVFTAKDPAMLDNIAVGDKVQFTVVDEGGKMVVTALRAAK